MIAIRIARSQAIQASQAALALRLEAATAAAAAATRTAAPLAVTAAMHARSLSTSAGAETMTIPYDVRLKVDRSTTTPQAHILEAALCHVPALGWTQEALSAGAKDHGYVDITHGLFPRGPVELVEYFIQSRTRLIAPTLADEGIDLSQMGVTARVRAASIARLRMTQPYINKWPQAAALLAQPQNLANTTRDLGALVDEIWYLAGDRSVDLNWYSKRMLLAGVYTSSEMFMTTDKSAGFDATYKFLDRRLKDVVAFGRTTSQVGKTLEFGVRSVAGILRSKGFFKGF
ncbi:COQ9-domain-containing protein [Entophlyctis helioformis]|nr:COQ9-domain-containing protein [Entophlyctis helioformis]